MKFPRRKFIYLAASAATLPVLSRIVWAQGTGPRVPSISYRGNAPPMRDLVAGRNDWLSIIKAVKPKGK
jgi:hypothetical protein